MKQPSEAPAQRKPYQPPKLLVYGDLTEMTRAKKVGGKLDGKTTGTARRTG